MARCLSNNDNKESIEINNSSKNNSKISDIILKRIKKSIKKEIL